MSAIKVGVLLADISGVFWALIWQAPGKLCPSLSWLSCIISYCPFLYVVACKVWLPVVSWITCMIG